MIRDLVKQGKKIGVTATSHKVILNLLEAVLEESAESTPSPSRTKATKTRWKGRTR